MKATLLHCLCTALLGLATEPSLHAQPAPATPPKEPELEGIRQFLTEWYQGRALAMQRWYVALIKPQRALFAPDGPRVKAVKENIVALQAGMTEQEQRARDQKLTAAERQAAGAQVDTLKQSVEEHRKQLLRLAEAHQAIGKLLTQLDKPLPEIKQVDDLVESELEQLRSFLKEIRKL